MLNSEDRHLYTEDDFSSCYYDASQRDLSEVCASLTKIQSVKLIQSRWRIFCAKKRTRKIREEILKYVCCRIMINSISSLY